MADLLWPGQKTQEAPWQQRGGRSSRHQGPPAMARASFLRPWGQSPLASFHIRVERAPGSLQVAQEGVGGHPVVRGPLPCLLMQAQSTYTP